MSPPRLSKEPVGLRGPRVPFRNLIDYLEDGHSLDEFLRLFPGVTNKTAIQSLEEAKDSLLAGIA